jgi:hypothetical protein
MLAWHKVGQVGTAMAVAWSAELLRLSLFASEPVQASGSDWKAITGQEESETRHALPGGGRSYVGVHRDSQLTISSFGQRLDIIRSAPAAPQELRAPIFGQWEEVREAFVRETEQWLASVRFHVVRVAFSCVLLAEAKDRLGAYELLRTFLKSVQVDPVGMRELVFRVNWPQKSGTVHELLLNRITSWTSIRLKRLLLQVGPATASVSPGAEELNFVRLEIDHNTDENRSDPFDRAQLVPIYRELIALASENASRGEVS